MTVAISEQGDVYIENIKYDFKFGLGQDKSKIVSTVGNGNESTMLINGDKYCRYDYVVRVIDIAKEIGVKRIMLGTVNKK